MNQFIDSFHKLSLNSLIFTLTGLLIVTSSFVSCLPASEWLWLNNDQLNSDIDFFRGGVQLSRACQCRPASPCCPGQWSMEVGGVGALGQSWYNMQSTWILPRKSQPVVLAMSHDDQGGITNPNVFNVSAFQTTQWCFRRTLFFQKTKLLAPPQ